MKLNELFSPKSTGAEWTKKKIGHNSHIHQTSTNIERNEVTVFIDLLRGTDSRDELWRFNLNIDLFKNELSGGIIGFSINKHFTKNDNSKNIPVLKCFSFVISSIQEFWLAQNLDFVLFSCSSNDLSRQKMYRAIANTFARLNKSNAFEHNWGDKIDFLIINESKLNNKDKTIND